MSRKENELDFVLVKLRLRQFRNSLFLRYILYKLYSIIYIKYYLDQKGCRLARCHAVGMRTERVTQMHEQTLERRRQHDQMIESSHALAHGNHAEYTISKDLSSFFLYYCHGVKLDF